MKKFLFVFFIVCIFGACSNLQDSQKMTEGFAAAEIFEVPKVLIGAKLGNIPLPDHTIVKYMDEWSVQLQLPEHVYVYAEDENGQFHSASSVCYTCDCSGGSTGCNVLYYQGSFACSECGGSCTGQRSACDEDHQRNISNDRFLFVDFSAGTQFIDDNTNTKKLYAATSFFFDIPEVQQAIKTLHEKYYGTTDVDELMIQNARIIGLNIFGVLVGYPMPEKTSDFARSMDNDDGVSIACSCMSGSSGCKYKKGFGGVHYCEGGSCTSCRMEVDTE